MRSRSQLHQSRKAERARFSDQDEGGEVMGRKIEPTYLGDGVYATEDDRGIVLTTGTHVITEADNVIVLEPKVWAALRKWAEPHPKPDDSIDLF